MSFNASQSNMTFSYGTIGAQQLTVIDVKNFYTSHGGSITPKTSVQFSPHLPNRAYSRTALTSGMPPTTYVEAALTLISCILTDVSMSYQSQFTMTHLVELNYLPLDHTSTCFFNMISME